MVPVAVVADAAEVEVTVGPGRDLIDAGLEALGHPVQRALELAVDLFEEDPLQTAVGHVANRELPREQPFLHHDRGRRGVGDLVVRHPYDRGRDRLAVEAPRDAGAGDRVAEGRVHVVEAARLDLDQLARRDPAALVVRHQQPPAGPEVDAVGRAQAAGDVFDGTRVLVDLGDVAAVRRRLRQSGQSGAVQRPRQRDVEVSVLVGQAERELVVVVGVGPAREPRRAPRRSRRRWRRRAGRAPPWSRRRSLRRRRRRPEAPAAPSRSRCR